MRRLMGYKEYVSIFDVLLAIAGVYMIFWGISGKGNVYRTETIRNKFVEKYKKTVKWFCLVGGVFAIASGGLEYFHFDLAATVFFYALCTVVLVDFILTALWTDKDKGREHRLR